MIYHLNTSYTSKSPPLVSVQHNLLVLIDLATVDATTKIRDNYPAAQQIELQTDSFVELFGEEFFGADGLRTIFADLYPVQRIATRQFPSVGPVERVRLFIEFEIDGLREVVQQALNVRDCDVRAVI